MVSTISSSLDSKSLRSVGIVGGEEHGINGGIEFRPSAVVIVILKSFSAIAESFLGLLDQKIGSCGLERDRARNGFFGHFFQVGKMFGVDDGGRDASAGLRVRMAAGAKKEVWRLDC